METSDSSETMEIEDPNAEPQEKPEQPAYIDVSPTQTSYLYIS